MKSRPFRNVRKAAQGKRNARVLFNGKCARHRSKAIFRKIVTSGTRLLAQHGGGFSPHCTTERQIGRRPTDDPGQVRGFPSIFSRPELARMLRGKA
jgi:hypothetical protein